MHVHILGPNLPDQTKGDFHVHAKRCADVNFLNYPSPDFNHDVTHTYNVASQIDAAEQIYADQINEGGMTAQHGVNTMHFFPCTADLPYNTALPSHDKDVTVTVYLGGGLYLVGTVGVDDDGIDDDAEAEAARQAAVAWKALTRNGVFEVGPYRFTATECAEWWA